jgi:hypothetical protein
MAQIGFEPISSQFQGSDREMLLLHQCLSNAKINMFWKPKTIPYNVTVSGNLYWLSGCGVTWRQISQQIYRNSTNLCIHSDAQKKVNEGAKARWLHKRLRAREL